MSNGLGKGGKGHILHQLSDFVCQLRCASDAPLSGLNGLYNPDFTRVLVHKVNFIDLAIVYNIEIFVGDDCHRWFVAGGFHDG